MAASATSDLLSCLSLIVTHKGNRFQVVPAQKVIMLSVRLLTSRRREVVLPDGLQLQCFAGTEKYLCPSFSKSVFKQEKP